MNLWRTLRRARRRTRVETTIDVSLSLDSTRFAADMDAASRAATQLLRDMQNLRYRNRLARERSAARLWWIDTATAAWGRYGWDWPGPAAGGS